MEGGCSRQRLGEEEAPWGGVSDIMIGQGPYQPVQDRIVGSQSMTSKWHQEDISV
jgi:hypothetical protein